MQNMGQNKAGLSLILDYKAARRYRLYLGIGSMRFIGTCQKLTSYDCSDKQICIQVNSNELNNGALHGR